MMTDEQVDELARRLEIACEEWLAAGNYVRPVGKSYDEKGHDLKNCNCPMGCLLNVHYPVGGAIASALGISTGAGWSFAAGFDGDEFDYSDGGPDCRLFFLGRKFRERYWRE